MNGNLDDDEVAHILFRRYKSDDGYSSHHLLDVQREQRKSSSRTSTPIPPLRIDELEKRWQRSGAKCDLGELQRLLERDDELINKKDVFSGFGAVHWAAKKGRLDVMTWLSEQKADINLRSNGGYTPLHIAIIHNQVDVVKKLIKDFDANINLRDYSGRKARHYVTNDIPFSVYRALQETPSIIELQVDPNFLLADPMMRQRTYSIPKAVDNNNLSSTISDEMTATQEVVVKKKKKGLSLSNSFKGKKKVQMVKRQRDTSPVTDGKPRWRKSLSVPDISLISGPYISFEQNI